MIPWPYWLSHGGMWTVWALLILTWVMFALNVLTVRIALRDGYCRGVDEAMLGDALWREAIAERDALRADLHEVTVALVESETARGKLFANLVDTERARHTAAHACENAMRDIERLRRSGEYVDAPTRIVSRRVNW